MLTPQDSVVMTTQHGSSSEGVVSTQESLSSTMLEAMLDESLLIQECFGGANSLSCHAMNEIGGNGKKRRTSTIGWKTSVYQGVIKYYMCNDKRFEAFVRDSPIPGERGRPGAYLTEIDAAKAHDMVSIKIQGLSTLTNFPVRCYWKEINEMQNMSKKEYILAVRRTGKDESETESHSPYRGVSKVFGERRWEARLGLHHEGLPTIFLGKYYSADDAARAYDITCIKLKGWDAITNFELNSYDVESILESAKREVLRNISNPQTMDGSFVMQSGGTNNEIQTYPQSMSSNPLSQHNTQPLNSSTFHGYQNSNLIQSNPYAHAALFGSTGIDGNSSGNFGAEFPTQSATMQQSLQSHLNVSNDLNHNILNRNQFLHQGSSTSLSENLVLQKCLSLRDRPYDFGKELLGGNLGLDSLRNINVALNGKSLMDNMVNESQGATNGVCSFGLQSEDIHPVVPSTQEFEAAQPELPALDQSYQTLNYQNPNQNLNSCFTENIQNPSSEPNNTAPESQIAETQNDFDVSEYLNKSFIEDGDFTCDFDECLEAIIGDGQGLS
ncbi:hypothetical protein RJT34_20320 [Clitoria ternatea]|uniref:AP2/ERF domain-containing protein n=1 Tax=Clitoria ternatea TaxID=43366 RepID=A0AAN9P4V2_CLITE